MTFDFSASSVIDFSLGAFGATLVEIYRLKRLLDNNSGQVEASQLQWLLNTVWFLIFILGSGFLAVVQAESPMWSAFYAGLTAPVFFSVIFKDNAIAEKELKAAKDDAEKLRKELSKLMDATAQQESSKDTSWDKLAASSETAKSSQDKLGTTKTTWKVSASPDRYSDAFSRPIETSASTGEEVPQIIDTELFSNRKKALPWLRIVRLPHLISIFLTGLLIILRDVIPMAILVCVVFSVFSIEFVLVRSKSLQRFINALF